MSKLSSCNYDESLESSFANQEKFRGNMNQEEISKERTKYKSSIDHHKNEKFIRYMMHKFDQITKLQIM